ncbi:MAG: glutaredoxin family protein [Halieaceae bacterium]
MAPASGRGSLTLYGTSACHLCELAEEILENLAAAEAAPPVEKQDISDDDALFEAYGERIPVLRDAQGRELGWPFDAQAVMAWLAA